MPSPLVLFAACQPGLEPLLAGELRGLGIGATEQRGGCAFEGDLATVMRAGLWLGTASHVLVRIAEFRCRALGELQRKAADLPWRDWLRPGIALEVDATTRASRVYHTRGAAERVAAAIAKALGSAPPAATADDEMVARVHVRFRDDVCTLSLDATSTPLHRRGYRLDARKAPLREDLAHALVLASTWRPGEALLDPFCGSGTIAIEAAGLALGLAPGRLRPPPLQHLRAFDADTWENVRRETHGTPAASPIAGSDRDEGAVGAARANADRAGVAATITWLARAISAQPWLQRQGTPPAGVLATNPPFGVRVAKSGGLLPLYQTLGHRAAALGDGWRVAMLVHDVRLARRTGLPLRPAFTTRHGGLAVTAMCGRASAVRSDAATPLAPASQTHTLLPPRNDSP